MRLIDADAFAEFLKDAVKQQKYEDTKINGLLTVADVIEAVITELDGTSFDGFKNAPTIEPERKKGHWEMLHVPIVPPIYKCSVCGLHALTSLTGYWWNRAYKVHKTDFCPFCGADMRGEQDED